MRKIERSLGIPADLEEKGREELTKAIAHDEATPPNGGTFKFKRYKLQSVKNALEKMFHGKCAYCETFYASSQPLDVEHYRPKGAVAEVADHRGYWWIAMAWENLLPSCIDCNRKRNQITPRGDTSLVRLLDDAVGFSSGVILGTGKKDSFPIADTGVRASRRGDSLVDEKPLLLDPCVDNPSDHLVYFFDRTNPVSFILPKQLPGDPDFSGPDGLSSRGATSVHVYGLNRLRLVQARTRLLRRLEFLADLAIELKVLAQELKGHHDPNIDSAGAQLDGFGDAIVAELVDMCHESAPYSAMVNAWMEGFRQRVEDTV